MPRPTKWKTVCSEPKFRNFGPQDYKCDEVIVMSVEEYEAIRCIDYEEMTQEECSLSMGVARTTIQRIYNNARKKLSKSLIDGVSIIIDGGNYRVCEINKNGCGFGKCRRRGK